MSLNFFLPLVVLMFLLHYPHSAKAEDCPPNVDPSYCAAANATGGKVYSGTLEENLKNLEKDMQNDINQEHTDIILSVTKNNIMNILYYILFFFPALLPFPILFTIRDRVHKKELFTFIYAIGNALPSFIFSVYFYTLGAGYEIPQLLFTMTIIVLILSSPLAYFKWDKKLPLYFGSIFSVFLAYLPILMMLTMTVS